MSDLVSDDSALSATKVLLYRDSFVAIWHDREQGWLYLDWPGQQTPESIHNGCAQLLRCMAEQGVGKVLNDNINTVGSWIGAVPWIVFEFLPRARKAGMRRAAHVYARNKLAKLSAEGAMLLFDPEDAHVKFFGTVDAAVEWLRLGD
jgi:hypothetical protein